MRPFISPLNNLNSRLIFQKLFLLLLLIIFNSTINFAQNDWQKEFDIHFQNWEHFQDKKDYIRAIEQAEKAFLIAEKNNQKELMAQALSKEGKSLLKKPKRVKRNRKLAEENFSECLYLLTNSKNTSLKIEILEHLKWIAQQQNDIPKATMFNAQIEKIKNINLAQQQNQSLELKKEKLEGQVTQLADQTQTLTQQKELLTLQRKMLTQRVNSLTQAQLESQLVIALQKNQVDSFRFKNMTDSLLLNQSKLVLAEQASKLELQKSQIDLQESQINLHTSQRNFVIALVVIIGMLAIGVILRYLETKKHYTTLTSKNETIELERKKSEQLLLNILPAVVANELKVNGTAKAKRYDNATVFFSDFKNFSGIAKSLSPEKLVHELDHYFKAFDKIIGKYNIEKIKTIGDAYMCVSGLPEEDVNNAMEMLKAALEIQAFLQNLKTEKTKNNEPFFEARIGLHTGPLVAGVVGSKKFAYDIWGDTVNIAARLEANGEVGKVNISSATYHLIKEKYNCTSRGKVAVKNRGEVEMFFVDKN
ncbi:MAG: adenylate/guanylate cyclase domain-containing protein [Saprospiraceae bacterium]